MTLWSPIFGAATLAAATGERAWLVALCDTEAALARACASVGLIAADTAAQITAACAEAAHGDTAELGQRAASDGNPVIPLVHTLRAAVANVCGPDAAASVHLGATSQDILDTACMLVTRRAIAIALSDLETAGIACIALAQEHRSTRMAARTLLQQALPTTFGAVAAGWGEGIERTTRRLVAVRAELAVQLGGAAGTLAGWHPLGPAVRAAFSAELGLLDPESVWHAERSRIADIAGALGAAAGVIAKVATDIVLLAQTEIAEVREAAGGGSSAMAHKENPIAAITARAAALQAPGLVATLLAAMPGEFQRAAGGWHAEWQPLSELLTVTGGAAARLNQSMSGLQIDPEAMRRNLRQLERISVDVRPASDVGHALDLVDHFLSGRSA